jgi:hypothetical protein
MSGVVCAVELNVCRKLTEFQFCHDHQKRRLYNKKRNELTLNTDNDDNDDKDFDDRCATRNATHYLHANLTTFHDNKHQRTQRSASTSVGRLRSVGGATEALGWLPTLAQASSALDSLTAHSRTAFCTVLGRRDCRFWSLLFSHVHRSVNEPTKPITIGLNRVAVAYRRECAALLQFDAHTRTVRLADAAATLGFASSSTTNAISTSTSTTMPSDFGAVSLAQLPVVLRRLYARWWDDFVRRSIRRVYYYIYI